MKAALLTAPRTIEVVDFPDPTPGADQVLVRVEASSICGSDLSAYRGVNPRTRLPTILGHEMAGEIVAVGANVTASRVGTRVCVEPNVCCGRCRYCLAGLPNVCPEYTVLGQNLDVPGGLAQLVAVNAFQALDLPAHLGAAEGALIQPLAISYHGVVDRAMVQAGETVLVLGAGPIGLTAMLLSKVRGARVLVADTVESRLATALRLGADRAFRADDPQFRERVMEATDGQRADVTIEAVGGAQQQSLLDAMALTGIRGRVTVLGAFPAAPIPFSAYEFKNRELTVMASHGHPGSMAPSLALVAEGRLPIRELISHTMPLARVEDALLLLDSRADGVMKVIIEP